MAVLTFKVGLSRLTRGNTWLLAAGPLEDLLTRGVASVIERVEEAAKEDAAFLFLLGSVWPDRIPPGVRERIEPLIEKAQSVPVPSPGMSKDH
jgi:hypothetical protein